MKRPIITGFIVIVLAALATRLFRDLERYDKPVIKNPSREAIEDPYLAFRRWTGEQGIELEDRRLINFWDYNTVILDSRRYVGKDWPLGGVQDWIQRGGHLCVFIPFNSDEKDDEQIIWKIGEYTDAEISIQKDGPQQFFTTVDLTGLKEEILSVNVDTTRSFLAGKIPDGSYYVRNQNGYNLLSLPIGSGWLTVSGSPEYLKNHSIGDNDNAVLAWEILTGGKSMDSPPRVLFLVGPGEVAPAKESRWTLPVIFAWLTAVALVVWAGSRRPESPLEAGPAAGSDIRRRLTAEGNFMSRYGGTAAYVSAGRSAAKRRLRRRGWRNPLEEKSLLEISERMGLDQADLLLALGQESTMNSGEYLRTMKILQQIEAEL